MTATLENLIIEKFLNAGLNISPSLFQKIRADTEPMVFAEKMLKQVLARGVLPAVLDEEILSRSHEEKASENLQVGYSFSAEPTRKSRDYISTPESKSLISNTPPVSQGSSTTQTSTNLTIIDPVTSEVQIRPPDKQPIPTDGSTAHRRLSQQSAMSGARSFHPLAREIDAQFRVLQDPTENVYTNGDIDGFISVFMDRFEKMRKLFRQRGDVGDALTISDINAMDTDGEVKVIGIVIGKRQSKNGNYLVELEDPTGRLLAVITQKDGELFERVNHVLDDQVICITGLLRVTIEKESRKKSQILIANDFFWADIPRDHDRVYTTDQVSVVLLSDMHFGSKNHLPKLWDRFVEFMNGRIGSKKQQDLAGSIKYVLIAGDLVDGIGIYPNQEEELTITDIFEQFQYAEEQLARLPDYIKIIYSPGNHEPLRNALPQPAISKKFSSCLQQNLGVACVGNPALVETHGIKTLMYHGDSLIDLNMMIPGLSNEKPTDSMKELLRGRHLGPTFGKKTEIAPCEVDWLVVDQIPDIFHVGHVHINGLSQYRGVLLVNSGCFQAQTSFMKSFGIIPTPGQATITRLWEEGLKSTIMDLTEL